MKAQTFNFQKELEKKRKEIDRNCDKLKESLRSGSVEIGGNRGDVKRR